VHETIIMRPSTSLSLRLAVWIVVVANANAADTCSCERIATVEAELKDIEARIQTQVEARLSGVNQEMAELRRLLAHVEGEQKKKLSVPVDATGKTTSRRGLSHPGGMSHYVAVDAKQIHEFGYSGSCQPGSVTKLLTKTRDAGTLSYSSSLSDASSDLDLVTVTDTTTAPWTTSALQTFAAPFKVVHDADCASAPTLNLPLDTTVQTLAVSGTLMVGGTDITTTIDGSCPSTSDTAGWVALNTFSSQSTPYAADPPRYKIQCGVVYLAGVSQALGSGFQQAYYIVHSPQLSSGKDMGFTVSHPTYAGGSPPGCTAQVAIRTDGYMVYGPAGATCTMNLVSLYGISYQKTATNGNDV